jgi:Zn-finger nucleic acid-binding protein
MGSTALSPVMSFRHHIPKSEDLSNEEEDQYIYKERKKHRFFFLEIFFFA